MLAERLSSNVWTAIYRYVDGRIPSSETVYGRVIQNDERRKLVWLKEFGDTPIPLIGYRYTFSYYDANSKGLATPSVGGALPSKTDKRKIVEIEPDCPKVGDLVVVLRQFGTRRIPKCVGVVLSTGWVGAEG